MFHLAFFLGDVPSADELIFAFAGLAIAISSGALAAFVRLSLQLAEVKGLVEGMKETIDDHEDRLRKVEAYGR